MCSRRWSKGTARGTQTSTYTTLDTDDNGQVLEYEHNSRGLGQQVQTSLLAKLPVVQFGPLNLCVATGVQALQQEGCSKHQAGL